MLRCMGFCGADDTVEPAKLKEISEKHEWVENESGRKKTKST